ncbi:hypothetical protein ACWEOZ_44215 [Actinoplanes sp. NPDC004185]
MTSPMPCSSISVVPLGVTAALSVAVEPAWLSQQFAASRRKMRADKARGWTVRNAAAAASAVSLRGQAEWDELAQDFAGG